MSTFSPEFFEKLFKVITNTVGALVLIFLFYILQYIFDLHFVCSCRPGLHENGVLYMAAPPMILTWVVSVIESFHQKKSVTGWQSLFSNRCGNIWSLVLKYLSLSVVWVATVLFDGDWYFCLMTNFNANETGIPCKKNLTPDEQRIKDYHKIKSLDFGFYLIIGSFIFWIIVDIVRSCCRRCRCKVDCLKRCWCSPVLCPPHYQVVYEDLLAEQVNCHLRDELTKIATEKVKGICEPYVRAVRDHERPFSQTLDADRPVSETWWDISASDFHLAEREGGEDPPTGAESSAQGNSDLG